MSYRTTETISVTPSVGVVEVHCTAPRSPCGIEECASTTQVILPRRGVFGVSRGRNKVIADPNVAIVLEAEDPYSVEHPATGGDRCTVLLFDDDVLAQALGDSRPASTPVSLRTQLATRTLTKHSAGDDLANEESAFALLASLADDFAQRRSEGRPLGGLQRRRVEEVCALVASQPEAPWRLATIGKAIHVSPFHLSRQFRAITGTTIWRYVLRLRLISALERIAEGETSLSRIASDAGFAHHSHLTTHFRAMFGTTPSDVRRKLRGGLHDDIRRRVVADHSTEPFAIR